MNSIGRGFRTTAEKLLFVLATLLILLATMAIAQLSRFADLNSLVVSAVAGAPGPPEAKPATNSARFGILDGMLVLGGSAASLVYIPKRNPRAWTIAAGMFSLALSISVYLAIAGTVQLSSRPARGDFAGLANLATLVVHVIMPIACALITSIEICLLYWIRRSSNERGPTK